MESRAIYQWWRHRTSRTRKKSSATISIFPYRTSRSHVWILLLVTGQSNSRKLSVYIPAAARWQNDDAYKTATVSLRAAYKWKFIHKVYLDYTKSEDVLYFTTIVDINDQVAQGRAPTQRPNHRNRALLLGAAFEYATYVDQIMQNSETNDIDVECKRTQQGQTLQTETRHYLRGQIPTDCHPTPDPAVSALPASKRARKPVAIPLTITSTSKTEPTFETHRADHIQQQKCPINKPMPEKTIKDAKTMRCHRTQPSHIT